MFKSFFAKSRSMKIGFTLIELLVVIAIIGVLASIVLASLNTARRKSRDARRISDIKQIQLGLELYFDGPGNLQYPVATDNTVATNCVAGGNAFGLDVLVPTYMPQIPRDPNATGLSLCYKYATPSSGTRSTYHLGTVFEETGSSLYNNDKDCTSISPATCVSGITATYTGGGFNGVPASGVDPVYDVIP